MIQGAHVLFFSNDSDADRAFFRDVLGLRAVDAGHGWLIFALPPAEAAVHPADGVSPVKHAEHTMLTATVYFMCADLTATIDWLKSKKVDCTPIQTAPWGIVTSFPVPSGGHIGLYQPTHPMAIKFS